MKPIKEGGKLFPDTRVEQFSYSYGEDNIKLVKGVIEAKITHVFEGLDPRKLNLNFASEITQRTSHPIDLYKKIKLDQENGNVQQILTNNNISDKYRSIKLFNDDISNYMITLLFQLINFIGFVPYKPDSYLINLYDKTVPDIRNMNIKGPLRTQLAIHNMLHVTWLKRLESSMMALYKSVLNYQHRIKLFEKWLEKGYIISLGDVGVLENEYDEDINRAFEEYEEYLKELDNADDEEKEVSKKRGIERKEADPKVYNLKQMNKDIERDKNITNILTQVLQLLTKEGKDEKINVFAERLAKTIKNNEYGKKVLVFSFFSDTVDYLKDVLPSILEKKIPGFSKQAAFVSGNSKEVEKIAKRFSPVSKKYKLKKGEHELNYLFATDVLSEGQNLQDAGILVNYDLHWNPVRMIQRNGRINRLGSTYDEVLIANARPSDDLEAYLKLVRRLERKIDTINSTVGNDQSILGEEANPIEFNDMLDYFDNNSEIASKAAEKLQLQNDPLDWTDDYSLELRTFLEKHKDDGEITRVKSIPKGKWNYLPKKNEMFDPTEILGLYSTSRKVTNTGEKIRDVGFTKISSSGRNRGPFSSIRAEYVEEQDALKMIKTTPDNNKTNIDTIKVNREEYISKGKTEIKVQFDTDKEQFRLKPAQKRALEVVGKYFTKDVLGIVQKGIKLSNEKKEFEQLVRKLNSEVKNYGTPFSTTIRKFEVFINKLLDKENKKEKLDEIEGVLFYAHNQ